MRPSDRLRQIKAEHIKAKREAAARAKRLSVELWSAVDRENALKFAEELEAQADELSRWLVVEGTDKVAG